MLRLKFIHISKRGQWRAMGLRVNELMSSCDLIIPGITARSAMVANKLLRCQGTVRRGLDALLCEHNT